MSKDGLTPHHLMVNFRENAQQDAWYEDVTGLENVSNRLLINLIMQN